MDPRGSESTLAETERAARQLKKDVKRAKTHGERLVAETRAKLRRPAAQERAPSDRADAQS